MARRSEPHTCGQRGAVLLSLQGSAVRCFSAWLGSSVEQPIGSHTLVGRSGCVFSAAQACFLREGVVRPAATPNGQSPVGQRSVSFRPDLLRESSSCMSNARGSVQSQKA